MGTTSGPRPHARLINLGLLAPLCVKSCLQDLCAHVGMRSCRKHAGVVLDGIGDATVLHANREMLQGRPEFNKGSKSATMMMYAFEFALCGRAVIATLDLSAANLDAFSKDRWLSNK